MVITSPNSFPFASKIFAMQQRSGGCGGRPSRGGGGCGGAWARSEAAVKKRAKTVTARRMNVIVRCAVFALLRELDARLIADFTLRVRAPSGDPFFHDARNGTLMIAASIA